MGLYVAKKTDKNIFPMIIEGGRLLKEIDYFNAVAHALLLSRSIKFMISLGNIFIIDLIRPQIKCPRGQREIEKRTTIKVIQL